MRSSTEVCLRNCASAAGSRDSSSKRKYSDTNRSSPVKPAALAGLGAPGLHRQRREVQAGGPALRPLGQLGELARVELDAGRFAAAARPLARPAGGPPRRSRAPSRAPASGRAAAPAPPCSRSRSASRPGRTRTAPRARPGRTDWRRRAGRRAPAPAGCSSAASALPTRGTRFDQVDPPGPDSASNTSGGSGSTPVDRGRDVAQEHHGVVVSAVERDPRERTRIGLGPPRKQRRLAVTGGRDHGRERRASTRTAARSRPPSPRCRAGSSGAASLTSTRSKGTSARAIAGPMLWGQPDLFHPNGMRRPRLRALRVDRALDFTEDNPGGTG